MFQYIFLGFVGLCSGVIIAGGITGLLMGLSIVPRYAGITRTADHILLYEDLALLGTVTGNLFYLFQWKLPLGSPFLMLYGIFSGIFLGGWIMALAEMADVFHPKDPFPKRALHCNPLYCPWKNHRLPDLLFQQMAALIWSTIAPL